MKSKTIFYILALCFAIRLYHITFPISGWHAWRQADTGAVAKNFYENGHNIFYPQIDWGGDTKGYVESEFHIYPFLISLIYEVTGVNDSVGRILSVIISLFTIFGIYILVRKFISENAGLWSALIYGIIPLNIYFNRAVMPETTMLMCTVYGIYFFSEWIDNENWKYFLYAYIFVTLAVLIKIPCLYLGFPLMFLAYTKYKGKMFFNWKIILMVVLIFIPVVLWYYHANQLLKETGLTFGVWDSRDKWSRFDIVFSLKFYNDVLFKSIAERHLTYAGFIPFVIGLFIKRTNLRERLFDVWLLAIVFYMLVLAKGNQTHEYYQLPFILPAGIFTGKAFAKFFPIKLSDFSKNKKINWVSYLFIAFFVFTIILSFLRLQSFYQNETYDSPLFKMSDDLQKLSGKNDLVISASNGDPIFLYAPKRKGWSAHPDAISKEFLEEKKTHGAKFLYGYKSVLESDENKKKFENFKKDYTVLKDNEEYFIFKLN